jgi:predicted enzyme related to lactoylglutathione lyase
MLSHPAGAFCFAELHTSETDASAHFYSSLLNWTCRAIGPGYWTFELDGRVVAGMRRGAAHRWVGYVHVPDVDQIAKRAVGLGAIVAAVAVDTPGVARTCLVADPEGAIVGLWSPRGVDGTAVETGPGSFWWMELATRNLASAGSFYAALFGWDLVHTMKFENGPLGYTLFKVDDRSTGGAFQFEPDWGLTPMWQVYFEVANYDAAVSRACELGGEEGFSREVPRVARIGVIGDPGHATFLIADPIKSVSA